MAEKYLCGVLIFLALLNIIVAAVMSLIWRGQDRAQEQCGDMVQEMQKLRESVDDLHDGLFNELVDIEEKVDGIVSEATKDA